MTEVILGTGAMIAVGLVPIVVGLVRTENKRSQVWFLAIRVRKG